MCFSYCQPQAWSQGCSFTWQTISTLPSIKVPSTNTLILLTGFGVESWIIIVNCFSYFNLCLNLLFHKYIDISILFCNYIHKNHQKSLCCLASFNLTRHSQERGCSPSLPKLCFRATVLFIRMKRKKSAVPTRVQYRPHLEYVPCHCCCCLHQPVQFLATVRPNEVHEWVSESESPRSEFTSNVIGYMNQLQFSLSCNFFICKMVTIVPASKGYREEKLHNA